MLTSDFACASASSATLVSPSTFRWLVTTSSVWTSVRSAQKARPSSRYAYKALGLFRPEAVLRPKSRSKVPFATQAIDGHARGLVKPVVNAVQFQDLSVGIFYG